MSSRWATREAGQDSSTTAEELVETANRLLHRQFITRRDPGGTTHFERVSQHLDYFRELFASFGFRFVFNDGWGYVGYVSPAAFHNARVPTQETIVLLCLRLLYSDGAEKGYFVDAGADILVEEEEIQTAYDSMGTRKLKAGELRSILITFKRQGLISFDQSHSVQVSVDVTLRPTLTEVVDESFLARITAWAQQSEYPSGQLEDIQQQLEQDAELESTEDPEAAQ